MKRFLSGLLVSFGLVSARRYDALFRQVEGLKTGSLEWKRKAGEAIAQVRSLEAELRRQTQLAAKLQAWNDQHRQRHDDVGKLRARLADAERELMVARDHLMAIEVKLDILEGAANVLDLRTRAAVSRLRSGTGAPA